MEKKFQTTKNVILRKKFFEYFQWRKLKFYLIFMENIQKKIFFREIDLFDFTSF